MKATRLLLFLGAAMGAMGLKACRLASAATTCQLYTVSSFPTAPQAQQSQRRYLLDYEVLDSIQVSGAQQTQLRQLLADGRRLSVDTQKRCPFVGKYGIKADQMVAVMSASPCAKLLMQNDTATVVSADLPLHGELEQLLQLVASQLPGS